MKELRRIYPHIQINVVLAYLPTEKKAFEDLSDTMYPEGMEEGPVRYAIDRRNRWLVHRADYAICYVGHTWGGAYKYASMAKRRGVELINLFAASPEI